MTAPILDPAALDRLRSALEVFTVDAVNARLGLVGQAAQQRGDLAGVARALGGGDDPLATLVRLFLLGRPVAAAAARDALHPLDPAQASSLLDTDTDGQFVRARHEVRPYGDETAQWWVLSDFGSDVRPGPLADDHVLGIGSASLTLAQATLREPVGRALDLGTGCGVQALHLGTHAGAVVATDVSTRALRLAATTAALSGQSWDLREGSLLDPVRGEAFDQIVANPPFVVSPGLRRGTGGFDYRDSGLAGDAVCELLLRGIPGLLAPGGSATMLANWIVPPDGDWAGRVGGWLDGTVSDAGAGSAPGAGRCDAWVWQREVVEPGAYVAMWLRDAGELPGSSRWVERYDTWLDWFDSTGVVAVGMGLVTLWAANGAGTPIVVCEDVPQAVEQPCGAHLGGWLHRQRWLARYDDVALLSERLSCADGVVRTRHDLRGEDGWRTELTRLRQSYGMLWELDTDDAIAGLVAACDGTTPLGLPVEMLAALTGRDTGEVATAVLPVVRDLVARGFLVPPAGGAA